MYMLVFVTLVVAITGVYAEALSVQVSRLYKNQTTIASTMMAWHGTAVAQAQYGVTTATPGYPGPNGCSLTTIALAGVTRCQNGGNLVTVDGPALLPACSSTITTNCSTSLQPGYNINPYRFYSIFYQPAAGETYVITFVPPPASASPGFITLPGGTEIGITMSDLFQQLKNSLNIGVVSYGMVVTVGAQNFLLTSAFSSGANGISTSFSYPLPTTGVPVNSIAIISSL